MNFSLRRKMIGAFALISLLAAAASGLSYIYLKQVDGSYASLLQENVAAVQLAKEIRAGTERQNGLLFNYIVEPSPEKEQLLKSVNAELTASIDRMLQLAQTEEEQNGAQAMRESNETFARLVTKVTDYIHRDEESLAKSEALLWSAPLSDKLRQTASAIEAQEQDIMTSKTIANNGLVAAAIRTLAVVSAASLLIALAIGALLSRAVVRPIRMMVQAAERIAGCDLTVADIRLRNRDELGELGSAFNGMKHNLRAMAAQLGHSTEQVAAAAEGLSANTAQLSVSLEQVTVQVQEISAGAEEQAQQVQAGAALIEEVSASLEDIAQVTRAASQRSLSTLRSAEAGQEAVRGAMKQMSAIERTVNELALAVARLGDRSAEVVQLVDIIAGIARQTNMLALNASIEAARAGTAGKGFAVVAEEVRRLSLQTAAAAEQAADLIGGIRTETAEVAQSTEDGSREVGIGMAVVREAGDAFERIREAADDVAAAVEQVHGRSTSIARQSQAAVESIRSIRYIAGRAASSTQEVSAHTEEQYASMEEVVSAAAMLSAMAEELRQLLAKFRV